MSLRPPERILVRGVNWLGDAVMTTPALARLRERFPNARLSLLTHEKLADLWLEHADLDEVITFEAGEGAWSIGRRLHAEGFDLALILPNSPRSALEAWFAAIPQRIGYRRPWRNWFLTRTIPSRPDHVPMHKRTLKEIQHLLAQPVPTLVAPASLPESAHHIHEYLDLAAAALGTDPAGLPPRLTVSSDEVQATASQFGLGNLPSYTPVLGLNPGAEYGPAKRWPTESFIAAAREIQKRSLCVWVLFGGKADQPLTAEIESALRESAPPAVSRTIPAGGVLNLAGKTSLRELMALLRYCRVLLTNDTGPMHVAAALKTPVVVPFGSTSPELTGPGLPGDLRHYVIQSHPACAPCFLRTCPVDFRCMKAIRVERIVEAVLQAGTVPAT